MSLPRRPKAVVFDLDGTLIDSEALVRDGYFAAALDFGVSMSDAQFLQLVGMHRDANDVSLRGFYGVDFPTDQFREAVRAIIGDRAAPLKRGAHELMAQLDELGLGYALATSSYRPWVERHFAAHGLARRFSAVITRDDVSEGKPHPEPYLKASTALGFAPREVLALEDSYAGVASAHAAGCMVAMIPDLLEPDADSRDRAIILASLSDVSALLSCAPPDAER